MTCNEQMKLRLVPTPAARLARVEDPETSHIAARKVTRSGKAMQQLMDVVGGLVKAQDAVNRYETWPEGDVGMRWGATTAEVAEIMGVSRYVPGRRMSEAVNREMVIKVGRRKCAVNGTMSGIYRPTSLGRSLIAERRRQIKE